MNDMYMGVMLDPAVAFAVPNERYLCTYVTMLANRSLATKPFTYLKEIENEVKCRFGPHLKVRYFDADNDEVLGFLIDHPFHLLVETTNPKYYSQGIH